MPTRDPVIRAVAAALVVAVAGGGCFRTNPDPRNPSVETMERGGAGGWIVLNTRDGVGYAGELIAVEREVAYVLDPAGRLDAVPVASVHDGALYEYDSDGGVGAWTGLGTLSTLSHGFILVFTVPIWLVWGGLTSGAESSHMILEIPGTAWSTIAMWARFPQGLPPGFAAPGHIQPPMRRPPPPGPPGPMR